MTDRIQQLVKGLLCDDCATGTQTMTPSEAKLVLDEAINNLLDDDYGNSTVDGALAVQWHINDARLSCE